MKTEYIEERERLMGSETKKQELLDDMKSINDDFGNKISNPIIKTENDKQEFVECCNYLLLSLMDRVEDINKIQLDKDEHRNCCYIEVYFDPGEKMGVIRHCGNYKWIFIHYDAKGEKTVRRSQPVFGSSGEAVIYAIRHMRTNNIDIKLLDIDKCKIQS